MMTDLLLKRAGEVAHEVDPAETSLLIVAHGTDLNENSAAAAKREAEKDPCAREIRSSAQRLHGGTTTRVRLAEIDEDPERRCGAVFYF